LDLFGRALGMCRARKREQDRDDAQRPTYYLDTITMTEDRTMDQSMVAVLCALLSSTLRSFLMPVLPFASDVEVVQFAKAFLDEHLDRFNKDIWPAPGLDDTRLS
jgi:hypothetical protein